MRKNHYSANKSAPGWPVWLAGVATLVFGLALLIKPQFLTDLIFNICGAALCLAGAFNVIRYFTRKDPYAGFNWELALGLGLLTLGVILIVFKNALLSLLPLLFGLALLFGGIAKIQAAMNMRRMMYARWYFTMIAAAVSCVLGILIIVNPFGTMLTLLRVIGGALVVEAAGDLLSMKSYREVINTHFVGCAQTDPGTASTRLADTKSR